MSAAASERVADTDATLAALHHGLARMAAAASRSLSSRAQAPFDITLESARHATLADLSAEMGPLDRVVVLVLGASGEEGFALLSRSFAFALLALRFGARPTALDAALPDRPYTGIEERTIRHAAEELWRVLEDCAGASLPGPARVLELEDAEQMRARGERRALVASFGLHGLSEPARILLAFPPLERTAEAETDTERGGNHEGEARSAVAAKGTGTTPDGAHDTSAASPKAPLTRATDV